MILFPLIEPRPRSQERDGCHPSSTPHASHWSQTIRSGPSGACSDNDQHKLQCFLNPGVGLGGHSPYFLLINFYSKLSPFPKAWTVVTTQNTTSHGQSVPSGLSLLFPHPVPCSVDQSTPHSRCSGPAVPLSATDFRSLWTGCQHLQGVPFKGGRVKEYVCGGALSIHYDMPALF